MAPEAALDIWRSSPEAKVILMVRDVEAWFPSHAREHRFLWLIQFLSWITIIPRGLRLDSWTFWANTSSPGFAFTWQFPEIWEWWNLKHERLLGTKITWHYDKDGLSAAFHQFVSSIIEAVPPADLLVFDVKHHGFNELSNFLGVPEVNKTFPWKNTLNYNQDVWNMSVPHLAVLALVSLIVVRVCSWTIAN